MANEANFRTENSLTFSYWIKFAFVINSFAKFALDFGGNKSSIFFSGLL